MFAYSENFDLEDVSCLGLEHQMWIKPLSETSKRMHARQVVGSRVTLLSEVTELRTNGYGAIPKSRDIDTRDLVEEYSDFSEQSSDQSKTISKVGRQHLAAILGALSALVTGTVGSDLSCDCSKSPVSPRALSALVTGTGGTDLSCDCSRSPVSPRALSALVTGTGGTDLSCDCSRSPVSPRALSALVTGTGGTDLSCDCSRSPVSSRALSALVTGTGGTDLSCDCSRSPVSPRALSALVTGTGGTDLSCDCSRSPVSSRALSALVTGTVGPDLSCDCSRSPVSPRALSALVTGTIQGWTAPALPYLLHENLPKLDNENITTISQTPGITIQQASIIGAIAALGGLVGALPAGPLADTLGRKKLLLLLTFPFFVGWIIIPAAPESVPWIYTSRFISGVAMGAVTVVVPLYSEEIAEDRVRGALGVYLDLMVTVGILVSYVLGSLVSYRDLALTCSLLPLLFAATFLWMPESPLYLVTAGKVDQAEKALRWLRGAETLQDAAVKSEMMSLAETDQPTMTMGGVGDGHIARNDNHTRTRTGLSANRKSRGAPEPHPDEVGLRP
uniref:Major facilitator superfamily (MFS) profile domain-containing protein n=1 Tax=Timema cristinae TaxID=61476 RepID=A0A7R9CCS4_TIMCR|nr:unnamed protein product [Timema cristinae]